VSTSKGGSASPSGNPPDGQAATGTTRGGRLIDRNLPYSCVPWQSGASALHAKPAGRVRWECEPYDMVSVVLMLRRMLGAIKYAAKEEC
jgi:hypothetical protein